MTQFFDSPTFTWLILPALIFLARICDMSLDTFRILMIGRGKKGLAAIIGFFEVCIWLLVARQVITHLPNPLCFIAYAGGFATGNYVGLWIEERMAVGFQEVRLVVPPHEDNILTVLRNHGYGLTVVDASGATGPVSIIYTVVPRAAVKDVLALIKDHAPNAFYSVNDIRSVGEGVFPAVTRSRLVTIFSRDGNL